MSTKTKTNWEAWPEITTVDDVRLFFRTLLNHGVNVHPDTTFDEYVTNGNDRSFTADETAALDDRMDECFGVCHDANVDVYGVCLDIFKEKWTAETPR